MPGDEVTVVQLCGKCSFEVATCTVKKDNLMLTLTSRFSVPNARKVRPRSGISPGAWRRYRAKSRATRRRSRPSRAPNRRGPPMVDQDPIPAVPWTPLFRT